MKQKAEEIYHRFVNYEWNDVGDRLQKSILDAIETALKEGQKLPIHNVSDTLIAWEQFKKANWWESDAVDVEKVLMDKFQAIYGR